MEPYRAPAAPSAEIDLAAANPGPLPIVAGIPQIVAGLTTVTVAAQLLVFITFFNLLWVFPWLLLPLGLAQMTLGAVTTRGRDWAAIAGTALTWTTLALSLLWGVYSMFNGFFALLTPLWIGLTALASLVAPFGVPASLSASRARRALYA